MAYAPSSTFTATNSGMASVSGIFGRIFAAMGRGITTMQIARMNGVLNSMTDLQLREIGITRREVGDYAEMLILAGVKK